MCDNLDNCLKNDGIYEKFLRRLKSENGLIKCKKCEQNNGFVLLQRKDVFCRQCFDDYCSHKFRSTVGKSKAVQRGDTVLIAFSSGISSSVMIRMIREGLNEDQHKRLRFIPSIVHIDESVIGEESDEQKESNKQTLKQISDLMLETDWNCFMSSIEMSYRDNDHPFYVDLKHESFDPEIGFESRKAFMNSFSSIESLTSKQEFIKRMRNRLILDIAKSLKFDKVFVANNVSNLAVSLLSDVSVGKGIQLQSESGFIDNRNEIPILRPMREFTAKEMAFFAVLKNIKFIVRKNLSTNTTLKSSIQRMTESFVNGLQTEFPSTVYTIAKTGNKLKAFDNKSDQKCIICNSSIDTTERPKCSALEALRFTHILSNNPNSDFDTNNESNAMNSETAQLCYSCNIIANEMTGIEDKFPKTLRKKVDKNDVKEFLIDYNEESV